MRLALITLLLSTLGLHAQWTTESYSLRSGWNAIYPFVDCTHTPIDDLLTAQPEIQEVWQWNPARLEGRSIDTTLPGNCPTFNNSQSNRTKAHRRS